MTIQFSVFILLTEMTMEILTAECRLILARPLCWVVRWKEVNDWRAICGITYSGEGVGKRGPLKAKSLNTMSHTHRHKETTHTNTHVDTHTHMHTGSGLGWGLWKHSCKTGRNRSVSYFITTYTQVECVLRMYDVRWIYSELHSMMT